VSQIWDEWAIIVVNVAWDLFIVRYNSCTEPWIEFKQLLADKETIAHKAISSSDARAKLVFSGKDESELMAHLEEILAKFAIQKYDCQLQTKP
jgi:hypothetical protein